MVRRLVSLWMRLARMEFQGLNVLPQSTGLGRNFYNCQHLLSESLWKYVEHIDWPVSTFQISVSWHGSVSPNVENKGQKHNLDSPSWRVACRLWNYFQSGRPELDIVVSSIVTSTRSRENDTSAFTKNIVLLGDFNCATPKLLFRYLVRFIMWH